MKEFSLEFWLVLLSVTVLNICLVYALVFIDGKVRNWKRRLSVSVDLVVKSLFGKGSSSYPQAMSGSKTLSLKTCIFTVLMLGTVIWIAYRATMNAFLAVKRYSLPINNFRDVLNNDYQMLTYHSSSTSDLFKNGMTLT